MNETDNTLAPRQLYRRRININIGNLCTHCGCDTLGDIDRIPSGSHWTVDPDGGDAILKMYVDGWMCTNCRQIPCDLCGMDMIEWTTVTLPATPDVYSWACQDCVDTKDVLIEE
jgi:hypothetical protein